MTQSADGFLSDKLNRYKCASFGLKTFPIDCRLAVSSLVGADDEGSCWPNCQTNFLIAFQQLST